MAGCVRVRTGGGPFAGAEFDDVSALGVMKLLFACTGVAAGFSMAAGAHEGDTEGNQAVAEASAFAGGKDEADVGKHDAKGANKLDKVAIGHVGERLKFTGAWTKSRKGDGELSLPTVTKQIIGVGGDAQRFNSPIAQAVESADAETAEAGVVSAFGSFETPIEIALGTGRVHFGIDSAVVSFLIDDKTFCASLDDGAILGGFHGADFEGDTGDFLVKSSDAIDHVISGDEFRMFAGDEKDVAKALGEEFAGFFEHFVDGKRDAQDRVVARETAIFAVVDAFVRKVKGREQADDFAETLLSELLRAEGEGRQEIGCGRGNKVGEVGQGRSGFA